MLVNLSPQIMPLKHRKRRLFCLPSNCLNESYNSNRQGFDCEGGPGSRVRSWHFGHIGRLHTILYQYWPGAFPRLPIHRQWRLREGRFRWKQVYACLGSFLSLPDSLSIRLVLRLALSELAAHTPTYHNFRHSVWPIRLVSDEQGSITIE